MVALRMSASGLTLLAMASGVQAQGTWTTVVPEATALSDGQPPSSFLETENTISPVGVSSALDARPALLQTNKFYAGFLVSRIVFEKHSTAACVHRCLQTDGACLNSAFHHPGGCQHKSVSA